MGMGFWMSAELLLGIIEYQQCGQGSIKGLNQHSKTRWKPGGPLGAKNSCVTRADGHETDERAREKQDAGLQTTQDALGIPSQPV